MCQFVFSLSDGHKHVEQPAVRVVCIHVRAYLFLFLCGCVTGCSVAVFLQRRRVAEDRGNWLFFVTSDRQDFHHRGISFQFSKPHHTSDAINKVFFPNGEEKCKLAAI